MKRMHENDEQMKQRESSLHRLSNASFKKDIDIANQVDRFIENRDEIQYSLLRNGNIIAG